MDKFTLTYPRQSWKGLKTKYPFDNAAVTQDDFLSGSKNFDTVVDGAITKRQGGTLLCTTSTSVKDQFEAIFSNGTHHLLVMDNGTLKYSSGGAVSTVSAGFSSLGDMEFAMYQDRVYFGNGIDACQSYDLTASYGGVSYSVPHVKAMGAQAPGSAPTAPGAGAAGGAVPTGGHTYKVSFLYYDSEESNGSAASTTCNVVGGSQTVGLTSVPIGGYGVTARKIYRDNTDGVYLLVGTISDNTTTTFSDTASIGTSAIPTTNSVPPKFSLMISHQDRIFGVDPANPSVLWWSNAGQPNIVDPNNFVLCEAKDPITGLVVYNGRLVIFNRHSMGQLLGSTSATFFYSPIPTTAGCVDNRSLQVLTSRGVPLLVWLSDQNFYQYNGSSVDCISEDIEDQISFNIQQALSVKGRNTQDTTADFSAGTSTPGISISGGLLSTINPQTTIQTEAGWEAGSLVLSCATQDSGAPNQIKPAAAKTLAVANGTLSGAATTSGGSVILPVSTPFSGFSNTSFGSHSNYPFSGVGKSIAAVKITTPRAGTLGTYTIRYQLGASANVTGTMWSNNVAGPASVIATSNTVSQTVSSSPQTFTTTFTFNTSLAAGTYWIGIQTNGSFWGVDGSGSGSVTTGQLISLQFANSTSGPWSPDPTGIGFANIYGAYTFTDMPTAASGQWMSEIYDSGLFGTADSLVVSLAQTAAIPGSCSLSSIVLQSDNADMSSAVSQSVSSLNGSHSFTFTATKRYWQVQQSLSTTDDTVTPTVGASTLTFPSTAVWTSSAIDCTDVTAYNSLTATATVPAGSSSVLQIATSDDNITYTSFSSLGSATVKRYAKLKLTLTSGGSGTIIPVVSNIIFNWTVVSTFTSSAISTGTIPAGWELFNAAVTLNGGTAVFSTRTAASSGGLGAASYTGATSGAFIASAVNLDIQWKVVITSTAGSVPVIDNVTVNWFVTSPKPSVRVASLFWNRTYYLAVAGFGSTYNNILYKYDHSNTWKRDEDIAINTLSFFFNDPYYGSSASGKLVLFNNSLTDLGTPITMDVRLPVKIAARSASDLEDRVKLLRDVVAVVKGTGASYQFYYSADQGGTWTLMVDVNTGSTSFTPPSDGERHVVRVAPTSLVGTPGAYGRSLLLRVVDSSAYSAEIRSLKAHVWVREQAVLDSNG